MYENPGLWKFESPHLKGAGAFNMNMNIMLKSRLESLLCCLPRTNTFRLVIHLLAMTVAICEYSSLANRNVVDPAVDLP